MPIDEITTYLAEGSRQEQRSLYMQLAIHCAPFLKGLKVSAMLTLTRSQMYELAGELDASALSWYFLSHQDGKDMVFLYRSERFLRHLKEAEVRAFLAGKGYPVERQDRFLVHGVLSELSVRMKAYQRTGKDFPHEVGVLLGYPTADVRGFIDNQGQNYLLSGYWKVYQDERGARERFAVYDQVREIAVRQVLEGKDLLSLCAPCFFLGRRRPFHRSSRARDGSK